jgi:hypothetical protein
MTTLTLDDLNHRADHASGIAVIYAALDAYADRVLAPADRLLRMKEAARREIMAGRSRAIALEIAKKVW